MAFEASASSPAAASDQAQREVCLQAATATRPGTRAHTVACINKALKMPRLLARNDPAISAYEVGGNSGRRLWLLQQRMLRARLFQGPAWEEVNPE